MKHLQDLQRQEWRRVHASYHLHSEELKVSSHAQSMCTRAMHHARQAAFCLSNPVPEKLHPIMQSEPVPGLCMG